LRLCCRPHPAARSRRPIRRGRCGSSSATPLAQRTGAKSTILFFLCGGAFVGLEKIVGRRVGQSAMGFVGNNESTDAVRRPTTSGRRDLNLLEKVQPVDLIRAGFIPEFIGRLPVVGVLEDLSKDALVQILTKPKNAIIRQYQKLFEFENVRLKFSDEALEAIAGMAMERKVGARGLRMILEDLMLDLMYYIPSYKKVREFQVTKEMVLAQKISLTLLEKAG
jgi:ATP-dependent Clp protease ATP-binding subunit ClpX